MGFNLRQKLEETFADINPFDNGATAQTVRANRAKAAPAQTVKTQTQSRPMVQQNKPVTIQQPNRSPAVSVSAPKQTLTFQKPQTIEPTFTLNQPNTMSQPQIKVAQQIQSNPANIRVQKPQFNTPTQAPQMLTPQAQKQWYQGKQDQQILAKGTVKQGQQVIQRQMDDTKRVKLDPLFKQGKSFEDMAKTAGYSNDEVRKFAERNYKGYGDQGLLGNVARETGKFVGTMVDNAAGIVRKPIVTINTALNRDKLKNDLATINKDLYGGNISPAAAQERANLLTKDLIGEKAYQDPQTGMYRIGAQNVAEFGGSFAQQGLDTGSVLPFAGGAASGASKIAQAVGRPGVQAGLEKAASVLTAGAQTQATSKLAQSLAAKGMSPQTANLLGNAITSNAKQSAVWGTAQTGTDVASGRGITPESLAMNYGADFLMGTVPEIGLGSVARGLDVTNARVHDGMVAQNPRYAQLAKSYETTTSPTAKAAIERQMASVRKRAQEGGFIPGPKALGFADAQAQVEAPQVGKTVNYLDTNTSQQVLNKSIQPKAELWSRWFKQSDYKALPEIEQDILKNPQIKDAGTSRMYDYYKEMFGENVTYDEFLNKDITLYRGGNTRATNNMASYSLLERKAKRFGDVSSITVKPKDTYGMLGDFSEGEVFVPSKPVAQPKPEVAQGKVEAPKPKPITIDPSLAGEAPDRIANDVATMRQDGLNTKEIAANLREQGVSSAEVSKALRSSKPPTPFEQDLQKAGLGTRKDSYVAQPKPIKKAIDAEIARQNPQLEYSLGEDRFPGGIPKIRPEDFKRVTGLSPQEYGFPPRYVSKTAPSLDQIAAEYERNVRGNIDGELKMDEDSFLGLVTDAIEANRNKTQLTKQITDMRNDPQIIAKAKAALEAEKAQYGVQDVTGPSKADLREYEKMMASQETAKKPATPAQAKRQSQVSKTTPTELAVLPKQTAQRGISTGAKQAKTPTPEQPSVPAIRQETTINRTYPDNTTETVKRRGFAQSIKNSDEVSSQVRRKVNGKYNVRSTEKLAAAAEDFASGDLKKTTNNVLERMDTKLGTLADQDIADAISVAKKLDSAGDFTQAQQIYDKLAEHGTKQGQSIQALSLLRNRTPEGVKYHMLKSLKKAGAVLNEAEQKEVMGLVDNIRKTKVGTEARDRALFATIDYVSRKTPTSSSDKLINFWRAGLLTAPKTTGGNILGNTTELVTERLWTNPVATATDKFFSIFTGKRTKTLGGGGLMGAKEGVARGVDYLKTGFDPRSADNMKFDAPMRVNYKSKVLDHYVNGVYKWMGAQDQPFYYAAKAVAAHDLAKADGLNLGYKGGQLADYIEKSVADEAWKPQTFKTAQDATKYAKYAVYQNKTLLGSMASGLKQGASHYGKGHGKAVVDFLIPFTQVPSSVAMRIIDRTPVGIVKEVVTQLRKGTFDQRAMSEAIANGSFGIPVIAAGAALAGGGLITGAYPTDQKEQKLWEAEGKQPYSVKVGDRWHSLNYMQPFGTILSIGKQVHDDRKDGKSDAEAWMNAAAAAAKSVESQSFLQGLNGALSAVNDPQRSMKKYVNQTSSSVIPNFIRSGATATDSKQREISSPFDSVQGAIPGLRQGLPAKQDMYGQDLKSKDNPLNMYTNPLNPSKVKGQDDVTTKELRRLQDAKNGIVTTEFGKTSIAGATLTDKQVRDLNKLVNTEVKSNWDKTIGTDNYNKLSDDDKVTYLKKIKDTIAENIKGQFIADNGITSTTTYKQKAVPTSVNSSTKALPKNLTGSARTILEKYDSLDTDTRKKWNTEKNTDAEVTKTMQSWIGDKVKVPEVTNEIAKKWADYQSDYVDGKISKLNMNDKKKAILKDAFNSQLSTDEKEIASLSKAELQHYYTNGVITDENINKAIAVEKQLFEAGLIAKETLQRSLGVSARGYKGSTAKKSSGNGSKVAKGKFDYKLNGFGTPNTSNSKQLHDLLKKAMMRVSA